MTRFSPTNLEELRDMVADALAAGEPLELVAGGSKRGLGRPLQLPRTLDLSRLSGIRDYQPSELVLTAGAATPLAEVEKTLADNRQMLAFEPPDWDGVYGLAESEAGKRTLGGVLAANLSGPRRPKAGAARDHFLGFRGVSGRGEVFKAGGKVVKNVTGYDLPKLLAGSFGTLAALEEVTVKVLPRPETAVTLLFLGLDPEIAVRRFAAALGSPWEVSAAAYLPPALTAESGLSSLPAVAALRLEGPAPSVAYRRERLFAELGGGGESGMLEGEVSEAFWRAIGNARPLALPVEQALWRISAAPARGAELALRVARECEARWYLDWGGGLLWAAVAGAEDGGAAVIRAALRGPDGEGGGH
ncbi:MAG TPA: FAD-binding protein, partial [Stellaceae bacterium]|nr:FAD-binding protein [Stellaceae bacterium]